MTTGTLNCPTCGAAVSSDSPQCQYCRALLQTVACPKCMGMMFMGSEFCPHCGVRAAAVVGGGRTDRLCPRCSNKLQAMSVADTPLDECVECGGLWIDISHFDYICSNTAAQEAATGLRLPPPPKFDPAVHYLKCPQCRKLMNRVNYARRSGVIIDICRAHGIWLDRDEMRQVIAFIRSGGLGRARKLEMEKLEALKTSTSLRVPQTGGSMGDERFSESDSSLELFHALGAVIGRIWHKYGNETATPADQAGAQAL